ncbi:hypothetical protein ACFQH2_02945 [Natronoarchaeum sp. GCM10025703]|uniref:hypothetical protein n=1 Tax=unclassified Natronoarchaeum TaxID=2620183 RepID=UPI00360EE5ED
MSHIKGTIHGLASMGAIILAGLTNNLLTEHVGVVERLSELSVRLLVETARLPVDEGVARIVIPAGLVVGLWVFLFELKQVTNEG